MRTICAVLRFISERRTGLGKSVWQAAAEYLRIFSAWAIESSSALRALCFFAANCTSCRSDYSYHKQTVSETLLLAAMRPTLGAELSRTTLGGIWLWPQSHPPAKHALPFRQPNFSLTTSGSTANRGKRLRR